MERVWEKNVQASIVDNLDHRAQTSLVQLGRGRSGKRPIPEEECAIVGPNSTSIPGLLATRIRGEPSGLWRYQMGDLQLRSFADSERTNTD